MTDSTHEIDPSKMSAAERLALGGAVAPILRRKAGHGRRITTVDKEGKPVRVVDDVALATSLLTRAAIEFSVEKGGRVVKCRGCRAPMAKDKPTARITRICAACRDRKCSECASPIDYKNRSGMCLKCNARGAVNRLDPEAKNAHAENVARAVGPKRRCACGKKIDFRSSTGKCKACNFAPFPVGERRGKLTIVELISATGIDGQVYRCRCACGAMVTRRGATIRRARHPACTISCGSRGVPRKPPAVVRHCSDCPATIEKRSAGRCRNCAAKRTLANRITTAAGSATP